MNTKRVNVQNHSHLESKFTERQKDQMFFVLHVMLPGKFELVRIGFVEFYAKNCFVEHVIRLALMHSTNAFPAKKRILIAMAASKILIF